MKQIVVKFFQNRSITLLTQNHQSSCMVKLFLTTPYVSILQRLCNALQCHSDHVLWQLVHIQWYKITDVVIMLRGIKA